MNMSQSQQSPKAVNRLGGESKSLTTFLSARTLAGTAAIMRLTPEEQEVESNCGSNNILISVTPISEQNSDLALQHDPSDDISLENALSEESLSTSLHFIQKNIQNSDTCDSNMLIDSDANMQIDAVDSLKFVDTAANNCIDHDAGNSDIIHEEEIIGNVINEVISDVIITKDNEIIGIDNGNITAADVAETDEIFFDYVAAKIMFQVDEAVAYALSLDVAGPVERMLMLKDALAMLLRRKNPTRMQSDITASDVSETMQVLRTIIGNARKHPNDPKFQKIKKSTKIFTRLVENRIGATRILQAAGFEEKGEYIMLGRDDPGLLYLVDSILEQSIAIIVR